MAKVFKGVRFDPDKLKLVMDREGLASAQQVVNWFLDQYYWRVQLSVQPGGVPLPADYVTLKGAGIAGKPCLPLMGDGRTKVPPEIREPEITPYEAYRNDLKAADSAKAIELIDGEIQRDLELTARQKSTLHVWAVELSHNFEV
jgi:hypothetical protein